MVPYLQFSRPSSTNLKYAVSESMSDKELLAVTKGLSLESIAEDSNESLTSSKRLKDSANISDQISEDIESAYTDSPSDRFNLKLNLDDQKDDEEEKEDEEKDLRALDTGRSVSEIPEESVLHTDLVQTEEPLDTRPADNVTNDKSIVTDRSEAGDRSEHTYTSSTRTTNYTDDFSDSESESATDYTRSDSPYSRSEPAALPSEPPAPQPVQRRTLDEMLEPADDEIDEEISEHFSGGSTEDSDLPALQLDTRDDLLDAMQVGDRVLVGGIQPGTLRYKGSTEFAPGLWGGVELDTADGTNDGSKDGVEYFQCRRGHGIFAPPEKLQQLVEKAEDKELEKAIKMADEKIGELSGEAKSDEVKEKVKLANKTAEKKHREKEEEKEQATEVAAQNLLNEAITHMLSVRRQKLDKMATVVDDAAPAAKDNKKEEDKKEVVNSEKKTVAKTKKDDPFADFSDLPRLAKKGGSSHEAEDILGKSSAVVST